MQHRVTASRDFALMTAAEAVEQMGAGLGLLLRESRLEVWEETDSSEVEELSLVHDLAIAEQLAGTLVRARLTIPAEPGVPARERRWPPSAVLASAGRRVGGRASGGVRD